MFMILERCMKIRLFMEIVVLDDFYDIDLYL